MAASSKVGTKLTQALQSALASGGPTLAAMREYFASLEPRDSLNDLIRNAVDPELLEAVLGPVAARPWVEMLSVQYERFRRAYPADWPDFQAAWQQQRAQWRPAPSPRPLARSYPEHDPAASAAVPVPASVPRVVPPRRAAPSAAPSSRRSRPAPVSPPEASEQVPDALDLLAPDVVGEEEPESALPTPDPVFAAPPAAPPPRAPAPRPLQQPVPAVSAGHLAVAVPPVSADAPCHIVERLLAAICSGDRAAVEAARDLWLRGGPNGVLYNLIACSFSPAVSERLRNPDRKRALAAAR